METTSMMSIKRIIKVTTPVETNYVTDLIFRRSLAICSIKQIPDIKGDAFFDNDKRKEWVQTLFNYLPAGVVAVDITEDDNCLNELIKHNERAAAVSYVRDVRHVSLVDAHNEVAQMLHDRDSAKNQ